MNINKLKLNLVIILIIYCKYYFYFLQKYKDFSAMTMQNGIQPSASTIAYLKLTAPIIVIL